MVRGWLVLSALTASGVGIVVVQACGRAAGDEQGAAAPEGGPAQDGGGEREAGVGPGEGDPRFDTNWPDANGPDAGPDVSEDQWCKPPKGGADGVSSCCNALPCKGNCLWDGTKKVCDCYGIAGGCPDGSCCTKNVGCKASCWSP